MKRTPARAMARRSKRRPASKAMKALGEIAETARELREGEVTVALELLELGTGLSSGVLRGERP